MNPMNIIKQYMTQGLTPQNILNNSIVTLLLKFARLHGRFTDNWCKNTKSFAIKHVSGGIFLLRLAALNNDSVIQLQWINIVVDLQ